MNKLIIGLVFVMSMVSMHSASAATLSLRNTFGGASKVKTGTTVLGISPNKKSLSGIPTTTWVLKVSDSTKVLFNFIGTTSFLSILELGSSFNSFTGNDFSTHLNPGKYTLTIHPSVLNSAYSFNVSSVPLPAAVWLFGSALLGLIGVGRVKSRTPHTA